MDKLAPQQLNNDLIRQKVANVFERVIKNNNQKGAYNLLQTIQESIEQYTDQLLPDLRPFYQSILRRLKFFFWPILPQTEQVIFLKNNLAEIISESEWYLDHHYPWDNQILIGMLMYPLIPRNTFRKKIKQIFDQNQGKIGSLTICKWLNDYNKFQDFTRRTNISHLEYLAQSPKAIKLNKQEKNELRQLFEFYDNYLLITPIVPVVGSISITSGISTVVPRQQQETKKAVNKITKSQDKNSKIVDLRNS